MIKRTIKRLSLIFILVMQAGISLSHADVLVDLAKEDEIVISNTQEEIAYTFKIDEPIEESGETMLIAGSDENIALTSDDAHQQENIETTMTIDHQVIAINNTHNLKKHALNAAQSAFEKSQQTDNKLVSLVKNLPFNKEVQLVAKETAIEAALIHAIISAESNHNPRAQSKRGAYGLMQLMPATAKHYKVTDKNDPKQNILAGAKLLRELLTVFKGDIKLSLAAYNAGLPAVLKHQRSVPPYKETQIYVPKVLKLYKKFT